MLRILVLVFLVLMLLTDMKVIVVAWVGIRRRGNGSSWILILFWLSDSRIDCFQNRRKGICNI